MALIGNLFARLFNLFAVLELTKNVCTLFFKKVDGIKNVDLVWMAVSLFATIVVNKYGMNLDGYKIAAC